MDMIWCFGRSLCFSRVCANKSGSGLCLVSEEILCESERDITRGEGLSTSPGSYNRQECWIIKTNPGRVECDGEPRQQSVGKLLRSDTMYNGHQMCSVGASAWCQLNMRCGDIWSSDISDHHQAHVSLVAEANNKRVDWLHSTHREPSLVRCVCRSAVSVFWLIIQTLLGVVRRPGAASDSQYVGQQSLWIIWCKLPDTDSGVLTITGADVMWDVRETGNIREWCDHSRRGAQSQDKAPRQRTECRSQRHVISV